MDDYDIRRKLEEYHLLVAESAQFRASRHRYHARQSLFVRVGDVAEVGTVMRKLPRELIHTITVTEKMLERTDLWSIDDKPIVEIVLEHVGSEDFMLVGYVEQTGAKNYVRQRMHLKYGWVLHGHIVQTTPPKAQLEKTLRTLEKAKAVFVRTVIMPRLVGDQTEPDDPPPVWYLAG